MRSRATYGTSGRTRRRTRRCLAGRASVWWDPSSPSVPRSQPGMPRSRVANRLPTLLAEIASVVFAVLLALALDAWWDGRERQRLAEQTLDVIGREIRGNREELQESASGPAPTRVVAALDSAITAVREERDPSDLSVNWNFALLSSAGWETAQLTGVTRDIPLDRVISLARLYEMQRFYARSQDQLASTIGDMGSRMETEPAGVLLELRSRYLLTAGLRETLSTLYACTLVGLEGPEVAEAEDCPDPGLPPSGRTP